MWEKRFYRHASQYCVSSERAREEEGKKHRDKNFLPLPLSESHKSLLKIMNPRSYCFKQSLLCTCVRIKIQQKKMKLKREKCFFSITSDLNTFFCKGFYTKRMSITWTFSHFLIILKIRWEKALWRYIHLHECKNSHVIIPTTWTHEEFHKVSQHETAASQLSFVCLLNVLGIFYLKNVTRQQKYIVGWMNTPKSWAENWGLKGDKVIVFTVNSSAWQWRWKIDKNFES